tara:strand:- start:105 stop:353 length:249 start_codon:yes stop_codon:yes gene_type:complete
MTKEHLIPKSLGGRKCVRACQECNKQRGTSGRFKPFKTFVTKNPSVWIEALSTFEGDFNNLYEWLKETSLLEKTLLFLLQNK